MRIDGAIRDAAALLSRRIVRLAGVAAVLLASTVRAEILAFSGQVRAVARGIAEPPQDSLITDSDAYARTAEPPVIDASASLESSDIEGNPLAAARSIVVLGDPLPSTSENPGEFALECGTFSNDPRIAYMLEAFASESRDVRFSLADVLASGGGTGTRGVVSKVFISGALVLWAGDADGDLSGTDAEFTIEVQDRRTPDAPALRIRRRFAGGADGTVVQVDAESIGVRGDDLSTTILDLEALRNSQEPEAAELVAEADRLNIDTFVVVLIGPREVEYAYPLAVGEAFALDATFSLTAQCSPSGTGVAGVMGRPFAGLADLFEESRTDADGKVLERSVNKLIESAKAVGDEPPAPDSVMPATGLCGAMGGPAQLAAMLLAWPMCRLRRRRKC